MSTSFKGLTITVGADTKQFNKEMKAVDRSIRETNKQVNELQKGLELEFDAGRFAEAQRLAQKAISDTEMKAQALRDQLKYLEETGADTQSAQFKKLQTELIKTENQVTILKNKLEEINNIRIQNLAKQFEDVGAGISKAGKVLTPFSAAAAGAVAGLSAMFKNTKDTAATLDDLKQEVNLSAEALQKWQYIAAQQGLDQATLQNSLIKTQQAFSNLVVNGTGPGVEALKALGFTAEEAAKGMDANYEVMLSRLAQIPDATQRAYLANEIFGSRMGAKIIPMLKGGAEGLRQLTEEFEALGYMTEDQITALADFDDELLRIRTALGALKDQVSVALIPVMQSVASFVKDQIIPAVRGLTEWFTGLSDTQKNLIMGTLGVVAALAPALLIVGKLTSGIGGLIKNISGIGKALSALTAHPIIAIIGVIVALLTTLYATNEEFRESINHLVSTIGSALAPILSQLGKIVGDLLKAFMPLINLLGELLIPVIDMISATLKPLLDLLNIIMLPILKIITPIIEIISGAISKLASIISAMLVPIIEVLGGVFSSVFGVIPKIVEGTVKFIERAVNSVISFINSIIRQINKLSQYIGFTIGELDQVSLSANITSTTVSEAKSSSVREAVSPQDVISQAPQTPAPTIITNNDYSNKDINIQVVVENYAENVDIDEMVRQINLKLAEQM